MGRKEVAVPSNNGPRVDSGLILCSLPGGGRRQDCLWSWTAFDMHPVSPVLFRNDVVPLVELNWIKILREYTRY